MHLYARIRPLRKSRCNPGDSAWLRALGLQLQAVDLTWDALGLCAVSQVQAAGQQVRLQDSRLVFALAAAKIEGGDTRRWSAQRSAGAPQDHDFSETLETTEIRPQSEGPFESPSYRSRTGTDSSPRMKRPYMRRV